MVSRMALYLPSQIDRIIFWYVVQIFINHVAVVFTDPSTQPDYPATK